MRAALPPQADRRVGRLRVRASEEGEARHFSTMLLDALRTASLPVAGQGQMLVVRNLPLGRISSKASAATLALRIELSMREARLSAVPFALPGASEANAVIFPSRAEALTALARKHARGVGPNEWFWKGVVAGWAGPLSRPERWLTLLESAHALPEGAVVSAQILREAMDAAVEDELLGSIPPGLGAEWLRQAGWSWSEPSMSEGEADVSATGLPAPSARHHEVIVRWERRWGSRAERLVWLATILAVAENPLRSADPRLAGAIARRLAFARPTTVAPRDAISPSEPCALGKVSSHSGTTPATPVMGSSLEEADSSRAQVANIERAIGNSPGDADASRTQVANAQPAIGSSLRTTGKPARPEANGAPADASSVEEPRRAMEEEGAQPAEEFACACEITSCAGLLFLVPVLERLGFADFLAAHPVLLECEFPARLLLFLGARAGLRPDDPLALALDQPPASELALPLGELPEATREILSWPAPRARLDSSFVAWLTAIRRWCRRRLRLGLVNLIRRPGRVAVSRTQIDVYFDLASADLRLRRLALDVDPGWVPWLGRVVRFHYLDAYEHVP